MTHVKDNKASDQIDVFAKNDQITHRLRILEKKKAAALASKVYKKSKNIEDAILSLGTELINPNIPASQVAIIVQAIELLKLKRKE